MPDSFIASSALDLDQRKMPQTWISAKTPVHMRSAQPEANERAQCANMLVKLTRWLNGNKKLRDSAIAPSLRLPVPLGKPFGGTPFVKFVCTLCLIACSMCLSLLLSPEAHADGRVALVIGNAAYANATLLRNSRNDADDISDQLRRLGFEVIDGRDLDGRGMRAALARFAQKLRSTDAALFYYSGHGLQIEGQNYLVPVDAQVDPDSIVTFDLVKLDDVVEALGYSSGTRLMVLDACRTNPFAKAIAQRSGNRGGEITRGLARIDRTQGMLIAYATQANAVAADGTGRNSPFTNALVREMQEPGIEVGALFRHVAVSVNRETRGQQTPELSVSLLGDFYLNPQESDLDAWKKMGPLSSASVATLKAFITKFPSSSLVDAARARIDTIENANERDRLVNEYNEKERQLRVDLEQAEAGFRKASEELAQLRKRDEVRQADDEKRLSSSAPAQPSRPSPPEPGAEEKDRRDQLANEVAALEANRIRLAEQRATLERAMAEKLSKAQSDRERAEQRLAIETARLPSVAADSRAAPAPTRQKSTPRCQEINARAQVGDISESDRIALRQCR
jgi:caspase domain-containing protein